MRGQQGMKYVVLVGDGMADRPAKARGDRTPLVDAKTVHMDWLAQRGLLGSVRTIPLGMHPGSDVANLSILGYDPKRYYSGRAPLEAASIGVALGEGDVAYRCNLVTLTAENGQTVMTDYSSGHIATEEARDLIESVAAALGSGDIAFYPGVSYRHLMVWRGGRSAARCVPPHDILGKDVAAYLPSGDGGEVLRELQERSMAVLKDHPVNRKRRESGKRPATSIWLWGQGKRPALPTFREKYGLRGALISAVDLTKGLGIYAGFDILNVPGATGWLDTNYKGKAEHALAALSDVDFVYVHVEAPDEAGHAGSYDDKVRAIEDFDSFVVGNVLRGLKEGFAEYRVLLMPDHATPVEARTHTEEPVPFVIYDSRTERFNEGAVYDESVVRRQGIAMFEEGHNLMDYFIRGS